MVSSFLTPARLAKEHDLASLHLRRDQCLPVILSTQAKRDDEQGYAEGVVTNTRFGSFPHSTIIGAPWGSQIRASQVDTGSRGRPGRSNNKKKRKAQDALDEVGAGKSRQGDDENDGAVPIAAASSGFVHVLPPTPESWTTSLPHRTQVVYTPDYSYILHRIRARPGSRLIEAGSGSGSFTHAAARAVFNGYPEKKTTQEGEKEKGQGAEEAPGGDPEGEEKESQSQGRVFSYEFHAERHKKVKAEMAEHGLDTIVRAMHRDVYKDGFLVYDQENTEEAAAAITNSSASKVSPRANAIFLDLPAPWEALPHLTREAREDGSPSPLDPSSTVHICTFSPCIEQVQKTVSALRRHDWLDIEMVEMMQRRVEVRRDYTGLQYEGVRGANFFAGDVDEAVARLRDVERRARAFHAGSAAEDYSVKSANKSKDGSGASSFQQEKLPFHAGKLVHRTEPELRTHTSYLVFATLPRKWTDEDEAAAQAMWSKNVQVVAANVPKSQRQMKKEAKLKAKVQKMTKEDEPGRDGNAQDEGFTVTNDEVVMQDEAGAEE